MKKFLIIIIVLSRGLTPLLAQQNWATIPCSKIKENNYFRKMMVDSLHNELILFAGANYSICNTLYKGLLAYNGSGFHSLDYGLDAFQPGNYVNGQIVYDCITYGNKTLFGGGFNSVGSDTLYAKSIALWNGAVWDTFPTHCFSNGLNGSGGAFYDFIKYQGKLWMCGVFDTIGGVVTKNIAAFNGNSFIPIPQIPANYNDVVTNMAVYKNKLIVAGGFSECIAQFDGTTWMDMAGGVQNAGCNYVYDMAVYNDTLFLSGTFDQSSLNAGNYIMKWDGYGFHDAGFSMDYGCGGWPLKLLPFKNRLYAIGGFLKSNGQTAFAAYYQNGTWTISPDTTDLSVMDAAVYNNDIYICGSFNSINGDTTIQKFAKLICPDFDAAAGCVSAIKEASKKLDVKVSPNPSNDKISIQFEQSNAIDKVSISNTLGQEVIKLVKPQPGQEIDVSHLSSGIYFLKAENKQGQGVFKLVKE